MEKVIDVIPVSDKNEPLKILVSRSNNFYQPILGFYHNVPNLRIKPTSLRNGFPVQPCRGIRRV